MANLGGILHPSTFKMNELIASMSQAFATSPVEFIRHKNLELALFGNLTHADQDKSVFVLLDGKIHNSKHLKSELERLGFSPHQDDDSEIIATAYKAWGEDFVSKLEGDFAIVLLDTKLDLVYLIRDRIGKKTLYWTSQGNYFLFSTELKGLLATGVVPQSPSAIGLSSYLYFGFIPQDLTPVNGVNKLLPGYFLKLQLDGRYSIEQYWSLSRLLAEKSKQERDFESVLEEAISSLNEKESIALLEHGGRGISFIEGALKKKSDSKYEIFHPNCENPEECLEDLVEIVWHLDEPNADLATPILWQVAKTAVNSATKTLFIDAGWEEMIAISSHLKSPSYPLAYRLAKLPTPLLKGFVLPVIAFFNPSFKWRILRNIEINRELMGYLSQVALFKGFERREVAPALFSQFDPEVFIERFHRISRVSGSHDLMFYFNAKTKVPDSVMLQHERLFTPHSIEVVAPFLEESVLNFAAMTPMNYTSTSLRQQEMVANLWSRSPYMRELFSFLPHGVLVAQGLISPKWLRHQLGYPYLVPKVFKKMWAILMLEIWFRLYINQPIGKAAITLDVDELLRS